jgi:hypothetical protein
VEHQKPPTPILRGRRVQVKWARFFGSRLLWAGTVITGSIMVVMEIVFLSNLLEAAGDLEDDEILFCPMGLWSKSYRKEFGGVIENDESLRRLNDADFELYVEYFKIFNYHKFVKEKMDKLFFYLLKAGSIVNSWEELFEGMRKKDRYLRNEIFMDVDLIRYLENYDLFLYRSFDSEVNLKERELIKSIVEGEVTENLVKKEAEKKRYYLEALREIVRSGGLLKEPKLEVLIPLDVKEEGVAGLRDYIDKGKEYVEYTVEGRKVLTISSKGSYGLGIETNFLVEYNNDRSYVVFGKVHQDIPFGSYQVGRDYLLGLPLFKGKILQISSTFRSVYDNKTVVIKKREKSKENKGELFAELRSDSFDVRALFLENPGVSVFEPKGTRRIRKITVHDSNAKVLQIKALERKENGETRQDGYKLCNIEIRKDGSFSVETDYNNVIDVLITPIKGDGREPHELKELIDKRSVRIGGRILEEVSYSKEGKRYLVLEEDGRLDEVSKYIVSSLYDFAKKVIRYRVDDQFPLKLSKEKEDKKLIETIQTGFIQKEINRVIGTLKKIVDLCFESGGGVKHFIKTHEIEDPEKVAYKEALYSTGIDGEGLKGEEKSIVEVLKIISYSYPLMDRPNVERVFEELRDLTGVVFSKEKVPLEEISVLVEKVNPEGLRLPDGYVAMAPSSSALFLVEGSEIKVYAKGYRYEKNPYRNVKLLKIGLGDTEIIVYG